MPFTAPTIDQLRQCGDEIGLALNAADAGSFIALMAPSVAAYNALDALPEDLPPAEHPRFAVRRPAAEENRDNAWSVKARVVGAATGKLSGKRVVLKDNVMLAGVPMANGAATLEGYVPDVDATVVTRILEAGGTIVGKANNECLCASGGSHTSATGPVHNPHRRGWSAGGSSSGCAVLVARGEADMAIGGDQGGSIRIPSSFSGICGLKPTYGLVPYTGIMPIEITLDHAGPMTAGVRDNALLLEVIAGADGYDPRQNAPRVHAYTQALDRGIAGLRIALLSEGFDHPNSEPDVDAKVRSAAARLAKLGATVTQVSIPSHQMAGVIFTPIAFEGLTQTMMLGDGFGVSRHDLYVLGLMDRHRQWRSRAGELSETVKLITLFGTYVHRNYGSRYYGKAINASRRLRAAYDEVLAQHDLLLLPTTPMKAQPLPARDAPRELVVARALEMLANTAPFDVTHHPALALPCGKSDGLPVSLMLVGRHFDEPTIYRAAYAFEQHADWREL